MPSTLDESDSKGLFALFKGESGSGKSVGALSFPKAYVFDFDHKMPAIAKKHFPGKDIHWDTFDNIFQIQEKLDEFSGYCPYETLISDSVTTLSKIVLNSVGFAKGEKPLAPFKPQSQVSGRTKTPTLEFMGFDYYKGETNFIERYWIDTLKRLWTQPGNPKHVIIIAHVISYSSQNIITKETTEFRSIVSAGKQVAAYLPSEFDEMWHFNVKSADLGAIDQSPRRIAYTSCTGIDNAKTAYNLPVSIDFTNGSLYDILTRDYNLTFGKASEESTQI